MPKDLSTVKVMNPKDRDDEKPLIAPTALAKEKGWVKWDDRHDEAKVSAFYGGKTRAKKEDKPEPTAEPTPAPTEPPKEPAAGAKPSDVKKAPAKK